MKRFILLLPVVAGIMFGSSGVFVRKLSGFGMDNPTVLFTRTAFAALCMLLFLLIFDRKLLKLKVRDIPLFLGTGLLGMLGLNLCYNEAINRLSLSLAAVLLSTAPVFVIILAAIFFKERITKKKVGCMLLAIVGCTLASGLMEQTNGMTVSPAGIGLGVCAAVFYALYSIFSRKATDRGYHTYTVIFYSVLIISIVLLPFADFEKIGQFISEVPAGNTMFLFAHALCTSVLPYIFITLALLHTEAGKVSILASGGEPIAAVVFGLLFYDEIPSWLMLAGLVITITALTLLCMNPKKEKT